MMRLKRLDLALATALAATAIPAEAVQDSARKAPPEATAGECAAPAASAPAAKAEPAIPPPVLVKGLGYAGIKPDTDNAEAERWFRQGVRLIWAYDEVEAVRSFEQAQKLDPDCAMCAWGEAWARGPTLNLQPRTEEFAKASAAAKRAVSLSGKLGERDRALVEAMRLRTSGDGKFDNEGYRGAMAKLAERFPGEDAVLVMAADSQIIVDSRTRKLKEGVDAQRWLEQVLKRNPRHSGAIHLYIHLTDFIDRQDLAERHADRLGWIAPSASHLVHMPSHTFYGVGRYKDAAAVNVLALAVDKRYERKVAPPASAYRTGLYRHNNHFAIESALMRGDGKTALLMADNFRERFPSEEPGFGAIIRAATWYAYGLHADPAAMLRMAEPDQKNVVARLVRHYARGEALARAGDSKGVKGEAASMAALLAGPDGRALSSKQLQAFLPMMQKVLEGRAAMMEKRFADAATVYREGMVLQGQAGFGSDPPPFWYSVRRSLGAALLASGDAAGARLQFQETLKEWPNDPLALYGLSRAEDALGQKRAAASRLNRAKRIWAGQVEAVPLARI
ncbi:MAG TPA: hypothetical protein VGB59_06500 [Allosphingosinicella sp.]|jgi:hypothetical protein